MRHADPGGTGEGGRASRAARENDEGREREGVSDQEADDLKRRARWGVVLLLGRTVVLQAGVFLANLFLARLLEPSEFGVFAVVQFVLALFNFFGDAGLGAALIQRKDEPTQRQLASVFCAQNLLAAAVVGSWPSRSVPSGAGFHPRPHGCCGRSLSRCCSPRFGSCR